MINRIHCRNYGPIQSLTKISFIPPYKGLSTYVEHNFIARPAKMSQEYLWKVLLIEDGTSESPRRKQRGSLAFSHGSFISIRATIVIGVQWHGMGQYQGQEELPQVDQ